jgi:hypothetical protein
VVFKTNVYLFAEGTNERREEKPEDQSERGFSTTPPSL